LPAIEQKLLDGFNNFLEKHQGHANCTLEVLEPGKQKVADLREVWQVRRPPALPHLLVRYPSQNRIDAHFWAGPWKDAPLERLLESPARREIGKRLLAGETVVWLLIESGNLAKDDGAAGILAKELKELETTLKLPEAGPGGKKIAIPAWAPQAKIAFSVLRLSRLDAAEKWLVAMLLGLEEDLERYATEPIVFPVFGRGATLEPLIGKGISPNNISKAVRYLAGPCTCEEKENNPVKDLLMVADWETGSDLPNLTGLVQRTPVESPGIMDKTPTKLAAPVSGPTEVPGPGATPASTPPAPLGRDDGLVDRVLIALGIGIAVVIGAGLTVFIRKKWL
jgi:hypothetical protein